MDSALTKCACKGTWNGNLNVNFALMWTILMELITQRAIDNAAETEVRSKWSSLWRFVISTILETTKDGCVIWRKYLYLDFNGGLWYRRITAAGLLRFILFLHSGACPTTWYENNGWCYRIFPELHTNWYQGADRCRSENADLLVIDSQVKLLNISNISLTCFRSHTDSILAIRFYLSIIFHLWFFFFFFFFWL